MKARRKFETNFALGTLEAKNKKMYKTTTEKKNLDDMKWRNLLINLM